MEATNLCAIVTGGTRGIGRSISKRFVKNNIKTIIIGREKNRIDETVKSLGDRCSGYQLDISNLDSINIVFKQILNENPEINILVNNAGICEYNDYFNVSIEQFRKTMDTNLTGHFFLTQLVTKHMIKNKIHGNIINIGSLNSFLGGDLQTDYSISKGGINLFTKSISAALGPRGIRVNTVCPGIIPTDINRERYADEKLKTERLKRIPLKRFGTPDEIASVVSFLASSEASYITGQAIIVDGGWSASYS